MIGPRDVPGIVLSGHTDVVPVAGQAWTGDPFRARVEDGRIYGRGAADMKGFLACVLALVPELLAAPLRRPAILAFSYDEEVGCKGVPRLIEAILAELPRPEACLVGEPTSMRLVDGHKGKAGYRCTVTGREAHSAYPALGANAVVAAARIIDRVADMGEVRRATGRSRRASSRRTTPRASAGSRAARSSTSSPTAAASSSSSAPCRARTRCASCTRSRPSPPSRSCPACAPPRPRPTSSSRRCWPIPVLAPPPDSDFARLCRELTGTERPAKVAFGTEGGCFAARGIPTLVCGPGDITVAHKPDEWVAVEQLERCDSFLRELVRTALS